MFFDIFKMFRVNSQTGVPMLDDVFDVTGKTEYEPPEAIETRSESYFNCQSNCGCDSSFSSFD